MFTRTTRTQKVKNQIASTGGHGAEQIKDAGAAIFERVVPATGAARDWAAPRLEKGWERSKEAAAPRVGAAAESIAPKVDAARDKLVEDLLPRLVESLSAASAAAGAAAADQAKSTGKKARAKLGGEAAAKRARRRRRFVVVGVIAAAGAAGYTAWKRTAPTEDPWAPVEPLANGASSNGTTEPTA